MSDGRIICKCISCDTLQFFHNTKKNLKAKLSIQTKEGIIRHLIAQDECIQQILRGEEPTKIGLLTSLPFCVYCKNDNVISVHRPYC